MRGASSASTKPVRTTGRTTGPATGPAAPAGSAPVRGGDILDRSSTGADLVQWLDLDAEPWTATATPSLLVEDLTETTPIRIGVQYQNRLNRHGYYWWDALGRHIWFESALEMDSLRVLDQAGGVAAIASQPMRLLFRAGSSCLSHVPDYLATLNDGTQVLYDVKPASKMTPSALEQFAETARVCEAVGWRHEVLHGPSRAQHDNLSALSAYRHARCHPGPERFERILDVFAGGRTLNEGRQMLDLRLPALAMPGIAHLLWHRYLAFEVHDLLDLDTVLRTTTRGDACCAPA